MTGACSDTPLQEVLHHVSTTALIRDAEPGSGLSEEVGWLHDIGKIVGAAPSSISGKMGWADDPLHVAEILTKVGLASLPLGRLYEGHVNALQLVALYGSPALRQACLRDLDTGQFWGVWGADSASPVQATRTAQGVRLRGAKTFCSGLGVVTRAVVSLKLEDSVHLIAVDVSDPSRADFSQWRVSGMRATQSGGYDFNGVDCPLDALMGGPSDYYIEPYFMGGMYRICAVQTGGLQALLSAMISSLQKRARASSALSEHRVGAVASRASTAVAITQRLAKMLSQEEAAEVIAREAVLGREAVERCAVEALEIVERACGTDAHREHSELSLIRRDLSFYLRQAAVDERLAAVGRCYLRSPQQ